MNFLHLNTNSNIYNFIKGPQENLADLSHPIKTGTMSITLIS